jgi:AcrR family transcriptional regulator
MARGATRRAAVGRELRDPAAEDARALIIHRARDQFLAKGYRAFTMDKLARGLGMSKKTLYVHFRSKESIIRAVLDAFAGGIRAEADRLLADETLPFAQKVHAFAHILVQRLARVAPQVLQDLALHAPSLHRHIEQLRTKNVPHIFGRFIAEGQAAGFIRKDIAPVFAGEFYLHAIQGMMHPATLQRLRAQPALVMDQALGIFFSGLLNSAGRKAYEKSFPH